MITNFADHSANERTFLAWVRTSVAIAGFGVIVENLHGTNAPGSGSGQILLGLSAAIVLISLARFLLVRRQIAAKLESEAAFARTEILFAAVLAVLVGTMIVFLYHIA